eukprot:CAMPEP_0170496984 /NCGR_PEP_ID=MMETSP0208-20121228/23369_1 /TAXON_ID=197538 /ORGANISM="Strombidium inclinatum, Strain S3" /LENGTH=246 /DNA_ID=CAMNT_0010773661 /DNA_START=802 /DNA_END=1542 /DNA_ORIENTATION=-
MAALSIYAFLGHVSVKSGIPVKDLSTGSLDLAFVAYPGFMNTLTMSNFWAVMFFLMLLLVGVDSIFGLMDYVIAYFWDAYQLKGKVRKHIFVLGIVCFFFSCGTIFMTNNGWWYFNIFIKSVGSWSILLVLVIETYAIAVFFGFEKLNALMHYRTGETIPQWVEFCTKYVSIPLISIITISGIYKEIKAEYDPWWTQKLAIVLTITPVLIALSGPCLNKKIPKVEDVILRQYGYTIEDLVDLLQAS